MKRLYGLVLALLLVASPVYADFDEGEAASRRGDYETAYREYLPLATKGYAGAQFGIAYAYLLGLGVEQDLDVGLAWLRKSADQGNVDALIMLSGFYKRGMGVPQDFTEASRLLKKAADTGDALGQYNLAVTYLTGALGKQDLSVAWQLLNKAAAQNLRAAQFNLGVVLLEGVERPADVVQAYKWFEIASSDRFPRHAGDPVGGMAEIATKAASTKTVLETQMTPEQIAEAQRLAREWKPTK